MARFAFVAVFPLVAALWVSPPIAQPKGSVAEPGGESQEMKASNHTSFAKNSRQPHQDLSLLSVSSDASENSLRGSWRLEVDPEGRPLLPAVPPRAWIGKTSPDDSVQYDVVALFLLLRAAVVACGQVLNYLREHLILMNLDAVMGTRIAEGQFRHGLLDIGIGEEGTGRNDPGGRDMAAELRCLHAAAVRVGDAGEACVRMVEPWLYKDHGALLQRGFWSVTLEVPPLPRPTSHTSGLVLASREELNGRQTDMCLTQVASGQGCVVTRGCWELMGSQVYSGYSLTHQVLFLIAGVQAGCKVHLDHLALGIGFEGGVSGLLAHLCSIVLTEAYEISLAGFPEHRRDLFMEQGALCGLLGYRAFFQEAWVARVLSWQQNVGCYGNADQYLGSNRRGPPPLDSMHTRVRREERVMTGNCLAHRSAVALGYLAVFTRFTSTDIFTDSQ